MDFAFSLLSPMPTVPLALAALLEGGVRSLQFAVGENDSIVRRDY
jgi:hypothetical protein